MTNLPAKMVALSELRTKHKRCTAWLEIWTDARGDAVVPQWDTFDPLDLPEALAQVTFLKRHAPDHWAITMFGSAIADRLGADLTGTNGMDTVPPEDKEMSIAYMDYLHRTPAVLHSFNEIPSLLDDPIVIEWLFLPFASEDGAVDRCVHVMGSIDIDLPFEQVIPSAQIPRKPLAEYAVDLSKERAYSAVNER